MLAHRVVALALPSVVPFDLAIAAQVFGSPAEPEYTFEIASSAPDSLPTSQGFALSGLSPLRALCEADTVVIPGCASLEAPPDAVRELLCEVAGRGTRLVSICTGAFILAATGLLDGLTATTHWQDATELQARFPRVVVDPNALYIDHGHVATSAGMAAGIDLCIHLVRTDLGQTVAAGVARRMVVPPHRSGGQAQYIDHPEPAPRGVAHSVIDHVQRHLDSPLTNAELARLAGISSRHFSRCFTAEVGSTPLQWVTSQRVAEARRLLETTGLGIDAIAARTGLGTATNLRRRLKDAVGLSPSEYRRTYRGDVGR